MPYDPRKPSRDAASSRRETRKVNDRLRKLTALGLFALAAISFGVLVSGPRYSEWVLPGGLPLGNALAVIGLCSSAGSAYYLSPAGSVRRGISQAALVV